MRVCADLTVAYAAEESPQPAERPLGAYAVLAAAFTVVFVVPLAVAGARGSLPRLPRAGDVALVGIGTFKLSRLLTRFAGLPNVLQARRVS